MTRVVADAESGAEEVRCRNGARTFSALLLSEQQRTHGAYAQSGEEENAEEPAEEAAPKSKADFLAQLSQKIGARPPFCARARARPAD